MRFGRDRLVGRGARAVAAQPIARRSRRGVGSPPRSDRARRAARLRGRFRRVLRVRGWGGDRPSSGAAYVVNNVALLSFSSMIERLGLGLGDERSLRLTTGLAEGTETIVVYVLFCVLPGASEVIAWAFAALVAMTAVQRVAQATRTLRAPSTGDP